MPAIALSTSLDSMYRLLVQGITDYAIYMLSLDGTVSNWNAGAQRFKGYTAEEIVGEHFSRFYPEKERLAGMPQLALETALREGRFEGEGWRLRKDGSRFWAHVILDVICDDDGVVLGFAKITRDMTAQRESAHVAQEQEQNFRLLVQGVKDYAIYMLTPDGVVSNWNAGAERAKGYKAEEIVGKHFSRFYSPEDCRQGLPYRALATALATGKFEGEGWRYRKDGSRFWAHVIIDSIRDEAGKLVGFAKITRDLTVFKRQMDEVRVVKENLDLALTNMSQGLCLFDVQERMVLCNSRFQQILGLPQTAAQPGSTFFDLLWGQYAQEVGDPKEIAAKVEADRKRHFIALNAAEGAVASEQVWDGRTIAVVHRRLPDGGWVSTMEDVTEKKQIETKIAHLAHHDSLTELPNRASLRQNIEAHFRSGVPCALLYLDLDRFKPVNDSMGHPVGDRVLQTVAHRIGLQLRKFDVGARLGGDEFAVLLAGCDSSNDATLIGERLIREISRPMQIDDAEVTVGASVGIAFGPRHGGDPDVLLRNADLALYAAKQEGRDRCREYREGMEMRMQERRSLEKELRDALVNEEFVLHYQPVVDVERNTVKTFEALLRWKSPTRGNVPPGDFIPFAEEIGLMVEIGEWVLRTACAEAATWSEEIGISVNLSAVQFGMDGLVAQIVDALQVSGVSPERLELEITESAMIRDIAGAKMILSQLRALGIQIALDDFGTGYSSLSFLRELPFTRIKIDQSFIRDLGKTREASAIVRAVTSMCDGLNVSTTAEGVETEEQLALLRKEGCAMVQGFLVQRPQCAADAKEWLVRYQDVAAHELQLLARTA